MVEREQSDDTPLHVDISLKSFFAHRDNWLLWRALGHYENGSWVAPVSFLEAQRIKKEALDVFMTLDDWYGRMRRQNEKKKKLTNA